MRGRSSKQGSFKIERVTEDNSSSTVIEEPHLSGAYIRNLVKQLTSSRVKDSMNQKEHLGSPVVYDGHDEFPSPHQNLGDSQETQPPQPPQHKKQVRRRLHTTRPYQEKFLNMAEARREIVSALKLHRASMNQANEKHPRPTYQTKSESQQASPQPKPEMKSKSRRNARVYASNTTTSFSNNLDNLSYQSFPYQPPQSSYSWPTCAYAPPPIPESFNLLLPNQTLGLNLNLQDFNNLETTIFQNNYIPYPYYSSSSPSTSNSPPLLVAKEESQVLSQTSLVADPTVEEDLGLHHAMDDEEMAEIRSVGEQYQIEWDDTMDLVTSAWWFKLFKNMEDDPNGFHPFDEGMEFPPWLNANDNCFQQLEEHDYSQNPTLPQMDIGEIEGMDGEWLG